MTDEELKAVEALKAECVRLEKLRREYADSLFDLRIRAGCGPEDAGPDIWQQNEQLQQRVKGALELAADLVAQRDQFIEMKKTYDGVVAELTRKSNDLRSWEKDARTAQAHLAQAKAANQVLKQELEAALTKATIAVNRYTPMLKENEHHRRERDVLETQLLLLRDRAISLLALVTHGHFSKDNDEEAAMRSDIQRELFAMATPRKS